MPVIKISAQEIKQGLPMKDDWYSAKIKSLGAESSKDGKSINYIASVIIDDRSTEGREVKGQFNSGYPPSKTLFAQMISAADGKMLDTNNIGDLEFDTDQYIGKSIKVKIRNELYQGNQIPKFGAFLPISVDTDNVPF